MGYSRLAMKLRTGKVCIAAQACLTAASRSVMLKSRMRQMTLSENLFFSIRIALVLTNKTFKKWMFISLL